MNKEMRIDACHEEFGQVMADMPAIIKALKDLENRVNIHNFPSSGTVAVNLKNMRHEIGNMKAAIAKDYIEELETLQKM